MIVDTDTVYFSFTSPDVITTTTSTVTYQSTPFVFTTPPNGIYAKHKRSAGDPAKTPSILAGLYPSSVSSACTCLIGSAPPPLVITVTTTNTFYSTLTSDIGPLATDTVTFTTDTTTTTELDISTTLPPTSTTVNVIDVTTTLPAAPTETIICDLLASYSITGLDSVFYTQNGVTYINCLSLCKANPRCLASFWFGDVGEGVITCRLMSISVKDALDYDFVGVSDTFNFADKDCPLVNDPGW